MLLPSLLSTRLLCPRLIKWGRRLNYISGSICRYRPLPLPIIEPLHRSTSTSGANQQQGIISYDIDSCVGTNSSDAPIVVIGGGIIGTSVAYHLAKLLGNSANILLLEQHQLTCGTTWHAAGLINTFGSLSATSTWMRMYTRKLYSQILPEETGLETGFHQIGFIELACDEDRLSYYRRVAGFHHYCCGVYDSLNVEPVQEITAHQVKDLFPLCEISDVLAGFYAPTDGRANPHEATVALAKASQLRGVEIRQGVTVHGITKEDSRMSPRVTGVVIDNEVVIPAKVVVNCAGMWARQFGQACGVHSIPNQAAEHYYMITEPMKDVVDPSWPVIEDSSKCAYIRPEAGGLMLGLFEWEGAEWKAQAGIPSDFWFSDINPDWDRIMPYLETAMQRVPATFDVGVKKLFCGPESFTPDQAPIVGPAPELRNYYVAAGLNSIGILTGGGIGHILAQWIANDGIAPNQADVTYMHINRCQPYQSNVRYRKERVVESLGNTYRVHYPNHQPATCRGVKHSPFHQRLQDQNAYFRDVSGWESPAWYAPKGSAPNVEHESFGRENWFPYWQQEHLRCRNNVALFDMSFMSKFIVQGRDAGTFLNRLSTANVDGPNNTITYTQWLNENGYMEADLTITKLREEYFLVVATDTMHRHVHAHMSRRISPGEQVWISDATGAYAQINIQGPKSRQLLQSLTSEDMSNVSFPFRYAAEIDIGYARLICTRITYVGELGYELFIPVEHALHVYDTIVQKGEEFDLGHAGLKALGSLRLEKGYRDYGHDMDNTDSILECGLGFTCDFTKNGGFIAKEHVQAQREMAQRRGGLSKRMASVLVPGLEDPLLHHGDIIWRNGYRVSEIRSASYGHCLNGPVGLTMLESHNNFQPMTKEFIESGKWEVEIAGKRFPCVVSFVPFFNPDNSRIKV